MLDDCAHGGFPQSPSVVLGEDALQRDCFRYRAACRERAEADETAKSDFRVHVHLQPVQYKYWDSSADEVGKGVKSEPYVAG